MTTIEYQIRTGHFHSAADYGSYASLDEALARIDRHAEECECDSLHVVVVGSEEDLKDLGAYETEAAGYIVELGSRRSYGVGAPFQAEVRQ